MSQFPQHDIRHCRTHAMVARLFAASSLQASHIEVWMYVAQSWEDLAALKIRLNKSGKDAIDSTWPRSG